MRLAKTRADATALCKGGHVEVNGRPAKAATKISVGDKIVARIHERDRLVEVTRVIDKRVGAPVAIECYIDNSPPPPERSSVFDVDIGRRDPGAGRPTKRERRQLEAWRRRNR